MPDENSGAQKNTGVTAGGASHGRLLSKARARLASLVPGLSAQKDDWQPGVSFYGDAWSAEGSVEVARFSDADPLADVGLKLSADDWQAVADLTAEEARELAREIRDVADEAEAGTEIGPDDAAGAAAGEVA